MSVVLENALELKPPQHVVKVRRAECRECGVDVTVPKWLGPTYDADSPGAWFFALLDDLEHQGATHVRR